MTIINDLMQSECINQALNEFVDHNDKHSIYDFYAYYYESLISAMKTDSDFDSIDHKLAHTKVQSLQQFIDKHSNMIPSITDILNIDELIPVLDFVTIATNEDIGKYIELHDELTRMSGTQSLSGNYEAIDASKEHIDRLKKGYTFLQTGLEYLVAYGLQYEGVNSTAITILGTITDNINETDTAIKKHKKIWNDIPQDVKDEDQELKLKHEKIISGYQLDLDKTIPILNEINTIKFDVTHMTKVETKGIL